MDAVDKWHTSLVRYAASIVGWADSEDVVQQVWQVVAASYAENEIIYPFLRRKTQQKAIDHIRKKQRKPLDFSDNLPEPSVSFQRQEPLSDADEQEYQISFFSNFPEDILLPIQKKLLWEHIRMDKTYQQLSDETGIAKSTIADHVALSRRRLAESLNKFQ